MKLKHTIPALVAAIGLASVAGPAFAKEGAVPHGVPHLDHVIFIMMENHSFGQIIGNPDAPFTNQYAQRVNLARNYFAVAHPSLTNYLEVTGGSNFNVLNDNSPDWHNGTCAPNIATNVTSLDNGQFGNICPIDGTGTDAATPVIDTSNETTPPSITAVTEIDGKMSIPADTEISGKTIADQLMEAGKDWRSYQESLTYTGADTVDYSDGFFDNNSDLSTLLPGATNIVKLYAVKHNPFVYFKSVQENADALAKIVGFEGRHGLFDDLESGNLPDFSFVVPNQCNDQHGQNNTSAACFEDPNDNGTLVGLNPGLIRAGDQMLRTLVRAIHDSPAWTKGRNAIVVTWDENDYSAAPNPNKVVLAVETSYGAHGVKSDKFYTSFALLKSIESGLELPCLNHACDADEHVMTDLFASGH
jgi:phosphatidylinositol-3-phosphatase